MRTTNPYHAEDCRRILVGSRPGGMVEVLVDDTHVLQISAAEARGLAAKLIIVAFITEGKAEDACSPPS